MAQTIDQAVQMYLARKNEFSGEDVIAASGVDVIEYTEKQFAGETFSDDEWSTL